MPFFGDVYKNKKILVTGHTGFKGSWLCFWLSKLGAQICGYSLQAPTNPAHYHLIGFPHHNIIGDIRDVSHVEQVCHDFSPDFVFHLAAHSLVRSSYENPLETFNTNVMGTVNVLETCRCQSSVRAAIIITSDKCYENQETLRPYQETDPMGGHDPYSASKGCAELAVTAYRRSFFQEGIIQGGREMLLASARAGNVMGGGDWAEDRLMPDLVRAAATGTSVKIRHPQSVRPWQHVLDALSGYLLLGQKLLEGDSAFAEAWNFGSDTSHVRNVQYLVEKSCAIWPKIKVDISKTTQGLHEAGLLMLDPSKARQKLSWAPVWDTDTAIDKAVNWYKTFYEKNSVVTEDDWNAYIQDAMRQGAVWTK
ncbi:MAG TPA: CDP-glucose 4,6-dehydratase [Candidatus Omnitrophota bacterium]|nr:CDP-glucose 4,6-dehydratase [Candidatus Omnitrophota bacterium]